MARQIDPGRTPTLPHVLAAILEQSATHEPARWQGWLRSDCALALAAAFAWRAAGAPLDRPWTIEAMVAGLGVAGCRALVRALAVRHVFGGFDNRRMADAKRLWWRGLAAAEAAERLAHRLAYPHPEEARLAAQIACGAALAQELVAAEGAGEEENPALPLAWLPPLLGDAVRYATSNPSAEEASHPLPTLAALSLALADHLAQGRPWTLPAEIVAACDVDGHGLSHRIRPTRATIARPPRASPGPARQRAG